MLAPGVLQAVPEQVSAGQEPPQDERLAAVKAQKRELGQELRERRRKANLTQQQLGKLAGNYRRSTVSNAENGTRDLSRDFWSRCDRVLRTGNLFADWYDCVQAGGNAEDASAELRYSAELNAKNSVKAANAYVDLGWPVTSDDQGLYLLTGQSVDVLEVPALVGALGAAWWTDTNGREDPVRELPTLPPPVSHLAVIVSGESWYFLVRGGRAPWPSIPAPSDRGQSAGTKPAIAWHSGNSRVPLPPGGPGKSARWRFLPSQASSFHLPPPHAVAYLLGRAAAAEPTVNGFTWPGGVTVMPRTDCD